LRQFLVTRECSFVKPMR